MNKLQEACIISHEHWLKELEQTIASIDIDIPEIKVTKKAKDKILPIKDIQSKTKKNRTIKRKVIKVLIIAAIILSLLMSVSAYKPFREFVVDFFDDYNSFSNDGAEIYPIQNIEILHLSKDYVLINENVGKHTIVNEYKNENKSFVITKNSADTYFRISNVYSEMIEFYNDNIKYTLFEGINGYDCTEVIWLTDEYSYVLTGYNLTKEEMIELAKNIK